MPEKTVSHVEETSEKNRAKERGKGRQAKQPPRQPRKKFHKGSFTQKTGETGRKVYIKWNTDARFTGGCTQ